MGLAPLYKNAGIKWAWGKRFLARRRGENWVVFRSFSPEMGEGFRLIPGQISPYKDS
jgi:hypothetical protein